jgi:hypothetical protein
MRRLEFGSMPAEIAKAESLLSDYFTEPQLATELGKAIITLRVWRMQRKGPPFTKNGRQILYHRKSTRDWLLSQEHAFKTA